MYHNPALSFKSYTLKPFHLAPLTPTSTNWSAWLSLLLLSFQSIVPPLRSHGFNLSLIPFLDLWTSFTNKQIIFLICKGNKVCRFYFPSTLLSLPPPPECQTGEVGTLLLVNPVGQNGLDYSGLLSEAAKVFGLRSRRLKLYLDQDLTQGKMETYDIDLCIIQNTFKLI